MAAFTVSAAVPFGSTGVGEVVPPGNLVFFCVLASSAMGVFFAFLVGLITGVALASLRARQEHHEVTLHDLRSMSQQEFLLHVENHVRALQNCGLPCEVAQYNDGQVRVSTILPGMPGIGEIFLRYGDD